MIDDVANDALDALSSCQCCLLGGQQRSLKTPYIHKRKAEIYSDMLRECFDIRLNLGSEKSGICLVCVDRLRDASSFKQQVQRSQLELRRRLTRALGIRDEEPAAVVDLEISDKEITSSKPDDVAPVELTDADSDVVICEENDVKSEQIEEVETKDNSSALEETAAVAKLEISDDEEHETNDNLPDEEAAVKSEESDDSSSDEELISHEDAVVKLEKSGDSSSDEDYISPSWSASMCARAKEQLAMTCSVRLDRLQYVEPPACQICHMAFDHDSNLATHMTDMHGGDENHTHTGDNDAHIYDKRKKQLKLRVFNRHNKHAKNKRFICELCTKSYSTKDHLRRHFEIHTGLKPFKCEICHMQFPRNYNLKKHLKVHTGEKPFECEICGNRFSQKCSLKIHLKLHTEERPFKCEICNKTFVQDSAYKNHVLRHTEHKLFKCEICNKQFTKKCRLKSQVILHTGEKPFSCEICNKQLLTKRGLNTHVMLHTGEKPFCCDICNKQFALKSYLTLHIQRHGFS